MLRFLFARNDAEYFEKYAGDISDCGWPCRLFDIGGL